MPRAPDPRVEEAKELFDQGMKLIDIAKQLSVSEGTVRSWKSRYKWGNATLQKKKRNAAKHRGGQPGNKNAVGHGAPKKNKNAEKHGFFSKYLPEETFSIIQDIDKQDPLDILWGNIQIAYAAIVRAQQIMYVRDQRDLTEEHTGSFDNGDTYNYQQAWDKQATFLKAQARAQSELRSLIKQYDELLHRNWDLASEEQRTRIEHLRAKTEQIKGSDQNPIEDKVQKLFDAIGGALDESE
ncbi:terminase [Eubacterium sp. An11]|uniref:phage terminase small subunit n=1 Tax=Eubacterium sp. An11 TaxID=1965542 RepID=UPI000B36F68C|nr:phage terminase small subunit [Eubacterium sp. An11]OUQ69596.1 terminase [Eubacterium sp. An11]